jgi:hypothetical protein
MTALAITIFVGVVLAGLFAFLFAAMVANRRDSGEREALLPLAEELPQTKRKVSK